MDIQADYSCYITLNNKTDVDFELIDTKVVSGQWPGGQPPNTIETQSSPKLHLKDKAGTTGSEGSVTYSLILDKYPNTKVTFTLDLCDPSGPWYDNYLRGSTNHPELISIHVHDYNRSGHPFYGEVSVYVLGGKTLSCGEGENAVAMIEKASKAAKDASQNHNSADCTALQNHPFQANFSIGFKSGGFIPINKDPVHENIAIAAFILAKQLPQGTTYNNLDPKQWEYIRGLVWNDDPSCLLFDDKTDDNHDFGAGLEWYGQFKNGSADCMTKRSHFGDLQCLHGMASNIGESPQTTQRNILVWLEVMYKLACGNQGVTAQAKIQSVLPAHFNGSTIPAGDATMKQLLLATTSSFRFPNIQRRALGVCLHIIQDSYAIGHAQRCLLNPEDLAGRDEEGFIHFRPNTYGRWGSIVAFHSYSGQDDHRHSHYDSLEGTEPVPKHLDTFNSIIGARDAIDRSVKLIKFFVAGTKWEDGVKQFLEEDVFAITKGAQPVNGDVDSNVGSCRSMASFGLEDQYMAGMQQKLASLDGGFVEDLEAVRRAPAWAKHEPPTVSFGDIIILKNFPCPRAPSQKLRKWLIPKAALLSHMRSVGSLDVDQAQNIQDNVQRYEGGTKLSPSLSERGQLSDLVDGGYKLIWHKVQVIIDSATAYDRHHRIYDKLLRNVEQPDSSTNDFAELAGNAAKIAVTYGSLKLTMESLPHEHIARREFVHQFALEMLALCTVGIVIGAYELAVVAANAVIWVTLQIINVGPIPELIGG